MSGTPVTPLLAVVGHPNKGKSSIVATLAHDESVPIAAHPGTTTHARGYPMRVDGELLYTLIDTPGFQRARGVLEWLRSREVTADARAQAVADFVRAHERGGDFDDECELLQPIVEGAGILYVVDGSKPYGAEYEAEMEILRWSGRPRMALVNPIASAEHVESWRRALGQYFSVVRVFDPMSADFSRQVALLRAFGELDERWSGAFTRAVEMLERDRQRRHNLAAEAIADMLAAMLLEVTTRDIAVDADSEDAARTLEDEHRSRLSALEARARRQIERIYDHGKLTHAADASGETLALDLFDSRTWTVFGLTPGQLAVTGAVGGAVVGVGVDVMLGGASLMLGSALGAAIGATSAWLGGGQLAEIRIRRGNALGGVRLTAGPVKDLNFPYVALGRALHHQRLVAMRTHAEREPLAIDPKEAGTWAREVHEELRRDLEKTFKRLRDGDDGAIDGLRGHLRRLTPAVDRSPVDAA